MSLPTKEEFIKKIRCTEDNIADMWDKPLYSCPLCKGEVKRDYSLIYATNPPKYRYFCKNKECTYSDIF